MSQKHDRTQTLKAIQIVTLVNRAMVAMGERGLTERQVAVMAALLARMTSVKFIVRLSDALRLMTRRARA